MSPSQLPAHILDAVRKRGYDDVQIELMSPRTLFAEYCEHHGLEGWGDKLWRSMQQLQAPKVQPLSPAELGQIMGFPAPKVAVVLEGGVVQGVVGNGRVNVAVIEYLDDADEDERIMVPQSDGSEAAAVGSVWDAQFEPSRVDELFRVVEEHRPAPSVKM